MKFYRLVMVVATGLLVAASLAHALAGRRDLALCDGALVAATALLYGVFRYPRRIVYVVCSGLVGAISLALPIAAFQAAIAPRSIFWSVVGALSGAALLGSVVLAMTLGHWYLVVRGMAIDPLKRLTIATLVATLVKLLAVLAAIASLSGGGFAWGTDLYKLMVGEGIFFWMRVGWGLVAPVLLYPMIWGTVKIRSTMAATGILYVAVVAVVIGEVLGAYLSSVMKVPL